MPRGRSALFRVGARNGLPCRSSLGMRYVRLGPAAYALAASARRHARSAAALFLAIGCVQGEAPAETATFAMPGTDLALALQRRPSHPYLAEYHRALLLRSGEQTVASTPLFQDSGGYSRTNVYQLGDSAYVIRDAEGSYVLHTARRTIVRDARRRGVAQLVFVGAFDEDPRKRWRFIPAAERAELPTEFLGG